MSFFREIYLRGVLFNWRSPSNPTVDASILSDQYKAAKTDNEFKIKI